MREKKKVIYGVRRNLVFMIGMAWRHVKSVLWLILVYALLSVALNLTQLLIGPMALGKVEGRAPLPELLGTILFFSLLLVVFNSLLGYVRENTLFGRIKVRTAILIDLNDKACTTSYPNGNDPEILKLQEKAMDACSSNQKASEHIWTTLSGLLVNLGGFGVDRKSTRLNSSHM